VAAIETQGVKKRYGSVEALRGVDLGVEPGRSLASSARTALGKTTAVRILTTLLQPDEGSARVNGLDGVHDPLPDHLHLIGVRPGRDDAGLAPVVRGEHPFTHMVDAARALLVGTPAGNSIWLAFFGASSSPSSSPLSPCGGTAGRSLAEATDPVVTVSAT
jgi:ABC-type phosphate/phosphonate transport system ATPase subunit